MKKIIFIVVLLINSWAFAHEFNMSVFTLSRDDQQYKLEMAFDRESLEEKLFNINQHSFSKYFEETTSWYINNMNIQFSDIKILLEEKTIRVTAYSKQFPNLNITSIEVKNNNFIDVNESHINIIQLKLNDKFRSFQMDKYRQKIIVDYNK